uniref:Uncharacterized protein n=1 Tax=Arion vulgaris TaxID=1028688 RepID=A0A0B7ABB9_9EUPU
MGARMQLEFCTLPTLPNLCIVSGTEFTTAFPCTDRQIACPFYRFAKNVQIYCSQWFWMM